jgi:hypothetical protein
MVQIVAPAGWLATGEAAPTLDPAEFAFAAAPTTAARVVAMLREHAVLWSMGAAVTLAAGGLVAFLTLRGGEKADAALPAVVADNVVLPSEEIERDLPPAIEAEPDAQIVQTTSPAPIPLPQESPEEVVAEEELPAVTPPQATPAPVVINEQPRTLTLEPVEREPHSATATIDTVPNYPSTVEAAEVGRADAKPQAVPVTNVVDQLAVPIDSIDLPAMPIGEFLNLVSGMAAVPIQLDAKVLGEVGLSTRSTVTVQGDHTTVGQLLADVLKEHRLTCVEREGVLVVVKAKR